MHWQEGNGNIMAVTNLALGEDAAVAMGWVPR
jgi:hypothetical protein